MAEYALIDGEYALLVDGEECGRWPAVAIGFSMGKDGETVLHEHGPPERVRAWADTTRAKYLLHAEAALRDGEPIAAATFKEMAAEITVIEGKFPITDLNRFLTTTGYLERWLKKQEEEYE